MSAPKLSLAEAAALASHTVKATMALVSLGDDLGTDDPRIVAISEAFAVITAMLGKATGSQGRPS